MRRCLQGLLSKLASPTGLGVDETVRAPRLRRRPPAVRLG